MNADKTDLLRKDADENGFFLISAKIRFNLRFRLANQ